MRILALSTWWPEPADNGSRLRISRLLQALCAEHEVHLVAYTDGPPEQSRRQELDSMCASLRPVERPTRPITAAHRLVGLAQGRPASAAAGWSDAFVRAALERARAARPEIIVAFQPAVAEVARLIPGVPRVLEEVELTLLYEQFARQRQLRQRMRYGLTWLQHRRYTAALLAGFDACTTVSDGEARLVRELAPAGMPVAVIPNGADVPQRPTIGAPQPDTLIYPGSLSYGPNLDAMDYFLSAIFPAILADRPGVGLTITGKVTEEQRRALPAGENVRFTGYVDDVKALVAASWAEVVPLRQGGGTRLKLLEALALGTPVVSTPKGAEGLALKDGEELLIADTPGAFADATRLLLEQPGLRARLAEAGRRRIAAQYDWRAIGRQLVSLLEQTVERRGQDYVDVGA